MKASCAIWPLYSPEHSLLMRDSRIGNWLRITHHLLGYQRRQEQHAPSPYCEQLDAQLNRYLIHTFQDHDFFLSRLATSHCDAASVQHDFETSSSTLLVPPIVTPSLNVNNR